MQTNLPPNLNLFQKSRAKPDRSDCFFYHSFDLPDGTEIVGDWDMRGKFDKYVGNLDLSGKRVIDFGTASGFLSFEAEKRGASVTSFDADSTARYCRLPHTPSRYTHNREEAIAQDDRWLDAVKNSYWYMYNVLGSQNRVFYGDLYNLPREIGTFDVAVLGQFLVHNRSGIDVLEAVAAKTERYLVITEGLWDIEEPGARFIGRASAPEDFYSNWLFSPSFFFEVVGMLGFQCKSFERHSFRCNARHMRDMELGVFVFERK
ncbi:MAG: class I SAM-dependent methyltransferase [Beijerinckiaceae bacterium]